jgi:hypothetical protein
MCPGLPLTYMPGELHPTHMCTHTPMGTCPFLSSLTSTVQLVESDRGQCHQLRCWAVSLTTSTHTLVALRRSAALSKSGTLKRLLGVGK